MSIPFATCIHIATLSEPCRNLVLTLLMSEPSLLQVLVPALLSGGWKDLEARCGMTPGVPLKPMLAKICEGLQDALDMLSGHAFLAEYKYDGMRAQIHLLKDGSVKVFSRNCEDRTASFPDVVAAIKHAAHGALIDWLNTLGLVHFVVNRVHPSSE